MYAFCDSKYLSFYLLIHNTSIYNVLNFYILTSCGAMGWSDHKIMLKSVITLCFVVSYFMSILVLQSSDREERAGCFA